jgi:hypothetical protein
MLSNAFGDLIAPRNKLGKYGLQLFELSLSVGDDVAD